MSDVDDDTKYDPRTGPDAAARIAALEAEIAAVPRGSAPEPRALAARARRSRELKTRAAASVPTRSASRTSAFSRTCSRSSTTSSGPSSMRAAAGDGQPLVEGVALVLKSLLDVLERHGVTRIAAKGDAFDPRTTRRWPTSRRRARAERGRGGAPGRLPAERRLLRRPS
jgi:hypothetical protein